MKQRKIVERKINKAAYQALSEYPDILRRVYASRGIHSLAELDYRFANLLKPEQLFNINQAAAALADAMFAEQKLLVIGDFDADGATSTSVAVTALRALGAKHVEFLVPNRFEFGYGLSEAIVEVAHEEFKPDWIITVDNGIANHQGVLRAKSHGINVLITDHHLPGETLPEADIIVNPNLEQCAFPSKALAGVGVIYYVMLALRAELEQRDWFAQQGIEKPNMATFLDLVALGTVADLVPLDHTNRLLVSQGMQRMRQGKMREGIKALMQVAGVEHQKLTTRDLGFGLGPRLNAAGRLEDMSIGISCLIETDPLVALQKAQTLNDLNEKRKQIESDMKDSAFEELDVLFDGETVPYGICVYDEHWHQGVIGILAGRIKEKYLRPTIVFAQGDNGELKGSARSVPGLHIRDLLADLDRQAPGLMSKYGGHAMAAGLSIAEVRFDEFRQLFDDLIADKVNVEILEGELLCDGPLKEDEISVATAKLIRQAGPWGQQFPEPQFCNQCIITDVRIVGQKHLKLKVRLLEGNKQFDAIWFNPPIALDVLEKGHKVDVVYDLSINEFQGYVTVQFFVQHINLYPHYEPNRLELEADLVV